MVASGEVRATRSTSSNVPAPVPCRGLSVNAFHASFHQRQRLLELALTIRPGAFSTCALVLFENSCQRALTKSAGPPARTTAAARATSTKTTSAIAAARATRRSTVRASTNRDANPTTTAPTTNTAPNTSPSYTRTSCGCPSALTPGRSSATPATTAPAIHASASGPSAASRSRSSQSHTIAATTGSTIPTREYVRTATTSAAYNSSAPPIRARRSCRGPTTHRPSGTEAAASNASSFQYSIG